MGVIIINKMVDINKVIAIMAVLLIGTNVKVAVLVQMRLLRFKTQLIRFIILPFLQILQLMKF